MKELFLLLAEAASIELVIQRLKESLTKYEADPSEENKSELYFSAMLLSTKGTVEKSKGGAMGMIDQMNRVEQLSKLSDIKPQ